jgi:hypothetical protein
MEIFNEAFAEFIQNKSKNNQPRNSNENDIIKIDDNKNSSDFLLNI